MSAGGRSATVESERELPDHRRAQNDPLQTVDILKSSHSTMGFSRAAQRYAKTGNNSEYSIAESRRQREEVQPSYAHSAN